MKIPYYPGCTLKTNALHFEESAKLVMKKLKLELDEIENWICCGTVFSMTSDDLMLQVGAIRNLLRAEEQDIKELVTLCSMCYNTLQRAKQFILSDPDNLEKVNALMYKENTEFTGKVEILHLLTLMRDRISFENIKKKTKKPLKDLKIGSYYGCMLLRPKEFGIDDFEAPEIMENLMESLGADSIDFPYKTECCGAYQTVTKKDITVHRTIEIIESARNSGCETIITSCPLCAYNLDFKQKEAQEVKLEFEPMPVYYFTELMAVALGLGWDEKWTALHHICPTELLKEKGLF